MISIAHSQAIKAVSASSPRHWIWLRACSTI